MKCLLVVALCAVLAGPVFGQSLGQAESDLSVFLGGIGSDVLSGLQQSALMDDGVGDAALGDFPHLFFSLGGGAVFQDGIGKIVDQAGAFQVLNIPQIIDLALQNAGNATAVDLYTKSKTFFPLPDVRVAFGVGITAGVEVIGQIAYWPQALTAALAGSSATANLLNAGLRVRMRLLADSGWFPAISIGAGYVYSTFTLGYNLSSFGTISMSPASFDFTNAALSAGATLHTTGVDVTLSKRLAFFVPWIRLSGWYQWGAFDAALSGISATIATTSTLSPKAHEEASGLTFLLSGGFGLKLGPLGLNIGGSYNPKTGFPSVSVSFDGQI